MTGTSLRYLAGFPCSSGVKVCLIPYVVFLEFAIRFSPIFRLFVVYYSYEFRELLKEFHGTLFFKQANQFFNGFVFKSRYR